MQVPPAHALVIKPFSASLDRFFDISRVNGHDVTPPFYPSLILPFMTTI